MISPFFKTNSLNAKHPLNEIIPRGGIERYFDINFGGSRLNGTGNHNESVIKQSSPWRKRSFKIQ